ncbi:MAG: MSEP-CTERM sorting domain-containing protein [Bacteroidota bacterium]
MKNLLNPRWIFIVNTFPIIICLMFWIGDYQIIKSLMPDDDKVIWGIYGFTLAFLGLINFAYGHYCYIREYKLTWHYALVALVIYISYLILFGHYYDVFSKLNIPQWISSGDMFLYAGTFLMPTFIHALFILVEAATPDYEQQNAMKNFAYAICVPIALFIFLQVILPLWQPFSYFFETHAGLVLLIASILAFLFFLIRSIVIIFLRKSESWSRYQLVAKIVIGIIFPILGLAINNGHISDAYTINSHGVFGNFKNEWFYIIALLNGLFLCLPNLENTTYRIGLFIGRSINMVYTFYFFLVFLPFLPLSVFAIIALGLGFLMLTPLLLFVIHINVLNEDFEFLKRSFSPTALKAVFLASLLVIPFFVTLDYYGDKRTLNQTLEYIYSPDYSKSYQIDKKSLKETMQIIQKHKNRRGSLFSNGKPFLTGYYNWLVLDNMILSDARISMIEKIFFGKTSFTLRSENIQNHNVNISNITTNSVFDENQNAWKSWIDLEITNNNTNVRMAEYATTFELPDGAWISDYYLYVGDRKDMGILSEKKAAMWVYSNIRNENKDPGILYYLTGNKVAFRVFPFSKNEVRKTGIEILHRDPIKFNFDGHMISLGNSEKTEEVVYEDDIVAYIPAKEKQKFKTVKRSPYFHFMVDITGSGYSNHFAERMDRLATRYPEMMTNARISLINSTVTTTSYDQNWNQHLKRINFDEGFFLERGIKSALLDSYTQTSLAYPVIVVLSDQFFNATIHKDFADWMFTAPETNHYYQLKENGILAKHSLIKKPLTTIADTVDIVTHQMVYELRDGNGNPHYLSQDDQPSLVLKKDRMTLDLETVKEKNWETALHLQAFWNIQTLHPDASNNAWLDLVKSSFNTKIMTPVTSYLVVENEAQKAMLKKKQEQILKANKSLDAGEDPQRMSEPGILILVLFLGLFLILRFKRKKYLYGSNNSI